ncbi:MAG: hypothetical protein PHP17_03765 [Candidatus Omnitrophica bacterium]|nr:hypothetical protein [Candidatus Omnitrophota bacterium]
MRKYIKFILIAVIFLAGSSVLAAQEITPGEIKKEQANEPDNLPTQREPLPVKESVGLAEESETLEAFGKHEAEPYLTFLPSVSSKDDNSHISIIESEFDYSCEYKLFEKIPVTFSLNSEYIDLNENSSLELPSHLTGLSAGLDVILPFFNLDKTYINLGASPSMYRDDWRFETSSFRMPVNTFLIYKPDDKWVFVGGLAFLPDYKDKFFPIAGFVYKPNDKWVFNITTDDPAIAYSPNDRITIFTQMELPLGAEFEVKKGNEENVVLIYNDMRIGTGLKYKINKFVSVTLAGGGVFDRYIRYRDIDGKLSIKNGGYAEFSVDIQI